MKILILACCFFTSIISLNVIANTNNQYSNNNKYQAQKAIYKSIYKINQLSNSNYHPVIANRFIKKEILPLFDFNYMAYKILENLPDNNQKLSLMSKIKSDIISTILQNLSMAKGRIFTPIGIKSIGNNMILTLKVRRIYIDLAMHNTQNGWKFFDIALGGQSLISYYQKLIFKDKL